MVRFTCIHCRGRIAVQNRQLGRLARCPECGGITHPLAEQLAAPTAATAKRSNGSHPAAIRRSPGAAVRGGQGRGVIEGASLATLPQPGATVCDNCGEALGKLQKPFRWDDHVVCGPCHQALKTELPGATSTRSDSLIVSPRARRGASREADELSPPKPRAFLVNEPRSPGAASDAALALRTAGLGLFATAAALFLLVSVLHAIGVLLAWSAAAAAILVLAYWARRGVLTVRRRLTPAPNAHRAIRAIVRT